MNVLSGLILPLRDATTCLSYQWQFFHSTIHCTVIAVRGLLNKNVQFSTPIRYSSRDWIQELRVGVHRTLLPVGSMGETIALVRNLLTFKVS